MEAECRPWRYIPRTDRLQRHFNLRLDKRDLEMLCDLSNGSPITSSYVPKIETRFHLYADPNLSSDSFKIMPDGDGYCMYVNVGLKTEEEVFKALKQKGLVPILGYNNEDLGTVKFLEPLEELMAKNSLDASSNSRK